MSEENWMEVYRTQSEAIERLTKERNDLQAAAGRFTEIMADKDRQLIAAARLHDELRSALVEFGEHKPYCKAAFGNPQCDCGLGAALAKARVDV